MADLNEFYGTPGQPVTTPATAGVGDGSPNKDEAIAIVDEAMQELEAKIKKAEKEKEQIKGIVDPLIVDEEFLKKDLEDNKYIDHLAQYVKASFEASEAARKVIEDGWIAALKQYRGIYSPEILSKIVPNRSRAFVRVTRTKVKTVDSRLCDLLFPANGSKNWGITPTPIPQLSPQKKEAITKLYEQESGEKITPTKLESLMLDSATKQSEKMAKVIEDQLSELKYREIMRDVIHSGDVYGTGILKGPLVSVTENKQYYKRVDGSGKEEWLLKDYDKIIPFCEHVRVWDIYPDMEATSFEDARYIVQRHKMSKQSLNALARREDFSGDVIKSYLKDNPEGDYEKRAFEITLQDISDIYTMSHADSSKSRKYEVFEFWGYVDTHTLQEWGFTIPEDKQGWLEIPCNVWVLGDKVIKCAMHPLEGVKWPYFAYYFDKDETSIFGEGIPSIMSTMQDMINSGFRAMLDNAAISAGPQIEVNLDLLSEDEQYTEVHPFKVWTRTGTGPDAQNPAIRHIPIQSYTPEFIKMLELFGMYSDEITTIPRYMWGDTSGPQGALRTSSGLSMMMGSANMSIKDQVKNFDDGITTPFIKAMYHWNMQFNEDDDIKGDYAILARGSASLIQKEMYTQYLIQFLNIASNPAIGSMVRVTELVRAIADAFDIKSDTFILSDQEIQAQKEAEAQEQQKQQEFMNSIIEAARENGTSPEAMISAMKQLMQAQKNMLQMQQEMSSQQPKVDYRHYLETRAPGQGQNDPLAG